MRERAGTAQHRPLLQYVRPSRLHTTIHNYLTAVLCHTIVNKQISIILYLQDWSAITRNGLFYKYLIGYLAIVSSIVLYTISIPVSDRALQLSEIRIRTIVSEIAKSIL